MSGWEGSTRLGRLPADWPIIRKQVLERDGRICYLCGLPGADTVDHIERGDNHDMANLAAVHDRNGPHCHRKKSSSEGGTANAARLAQARRPAEPHPGLR